MVDGMMGQPLGVGQSGHDGGVHAFHASPAVLRCELCRLPSHSHTRMHAHIHTPLAIGLLYGCTHSLCPHTNRATVSVHAVAGRVEGAVCCSFGTGTDVADQHKHALLPRMGLLWTAGCWLYCCMQ